MPSNTLKNEKTNLDISSKNSRNESVTTTILFESKESFSRIKEFSKNFYINYQLKGNGNKKIPEKWWPPIFKINIKEGVE